MPRIKTVTINPDQKTALENGVKYDSTPSYRKRCQGILLKGEKRTSLAIAKELGCCEMSINDWMKRFDEQGIDGLKVAKGRGGKSILQHKDAEAVRRAVQNHAQRLSLAKAELEQELGRTFSQLTLQRFLKKTIAMAKVPFARTNELGG